MTVKKKTWSKDNLTYSFFLDFPTDKDNHTKLAAITVYVYLGIFQMLPRQFNRETVQGSFVRLSSKQNINSLKKNTHTTHFNFQMKKKIFSFYCIF